MTKVVVIGAARSGTSTLINTLQQHPQVRPVTYEIFNPNILHLGREPIHANVLQIYIDTFKQYKLSKNNFEKWDIEKLPLIRMIKETLRTCNGFKVLYEQLPRCSPAWKYILSSHIKVIHIHRRNHLERIVSSMAARKTQQWNVRPDDPPVQDEMMKITVQQLDAMLGHSHANEMFFSKMFWSGDNPCVLDLEHTEFADWGIMWGKITKFLGVDHIDIPPFFRKRTTKKPNQLLVNYDELHDAFRCTPWHDMFS